MAPMRMISTAAYGAAGGVLPAASIVVMTTTTPNAAQAPVVREVQLQDATRDHQVGAWRPGGATPEMKAPGGPEELLDGSAAVRDRPLGEALDAGDADGGRCWARLVGGIKIAHPVAVRRD